MTRGFEQDVVYWREQAQSSRVPILTAKDVVALFCLFVVDEDDSYGSKSIGLEGKKIGEERIRIGLDKCLGSCYNRQSGICWLVSISLYISGAGFGSGIRMMLDDIWPWVDCNGRERSKIED